MKGSYACDVMSVTVAWFVIGADNPRFAAVGTVKWCPGTSLSIHPPIRPTIHPPALGYRTARFGHLVLVNVPRQPAAAVAASSSYFGIE